jgi:hypothetical protein
MSLANKVKVRAHVAHFIKNEVLGSPYLFVNICNTYKRQHIKVVKVQILENHGVTPNGNRYLGIDVNGGGARSLPVTILPKTEWETWIKMGDVGESEGFNDIIVLLANGRYLTSKKRKNVSPSGVVPGNALV